MGDEYTDTSTRDIILKVANKIAQMERFECGVDHTTYKAHEKMLQEIRNEQLKQSMILESLQKDKEMTDTHETRIVVLENFVTDTKETTKGVVQAKGAAYIAIGVAMLPIVWEVFTKFIKGVK